MKKASTPQLYYVEWADSCAASHWRPMHELREGNRWAPIRSVGWLVASSKQAVTIVAHMGYDRDGQPDQGTGEMTIPRRAVLKMRRLKEPK